MQMNVCVWTCPSLSSHTCVILYSVLLIRNFKCPIKCPHNVHIIIERSHWYLSLENFSGSKVCSLDWDVHKQRERNVPLVSADVLGKEGCVMNLKSVCVGG